MIRTSFLFISIFIIIYYSKYFLFNDIEQCFIEWSKTKDQSMHILYTFLFVIETISIKCVFSANIALGKKLKTFACKEDMAFSISPYLKI